RRAHSGADTRNRGAGPQRSEHQSRDAESLDVVHLAHREEARLTSTPATASTPERDAPHATSSSVDRDVSTRSVFAALLRRDLRVARRELPYSLVRTLMQPLLFIIVFGYLLPKMGFVRGGYTTALLPGIIAV